jgi:hypothetical protein
VSRADYSTRVDVGMKVNAVFEGGGVRGVALAGAAAATLDTGLEVDQAVGTSAERFLRSPSPRNSATPRSRWRTPAAGVSQAATASPKTTADLASSAVPLPSKYDRAV